MQSEVRQDLVHGMNPLSGNYRELRQRFGRLASLLCRVILSSRGQGCLLLILLAGCMAPAPDGQQTERLPTDAEVEQYNAQVAPEDRIVCRDETSVGSNIPRRRCRYIRDIEETSRITREQLRNILH